MTIATASGFGGLENTPLARIGYYNKIIARGWEKDFLPLITNTEIDERITQCNQVVQFTRQPLAGPWRPYEKNQELVPEQVTPEGFCMRICNAAYKDLKFDKLDIARICERFAPFEESLLDSAYQGLAEEWRCYVLNGMVLETSAKNKGNHAGKSCNIDLGTINAPRVITGVSFGREVAKLKRTLQEARRWEDGKMVMILPPAIQELLVESPYANALQMGSCVDCSLLVTGQLPGKIVGFDVFVTNAVPAVIDATTQTEAYYIIAAHRDAFAFAGDLIEGELVRPSRYFGIEYQMLAVWGSKAILPDAMAVGYWTV
jgi:hypothetical protein